MEHTNGHATTIEQPSVDGPRQINIDPGSPGPGDERPGDTMAPSEVSPGQPARKRTRTRTARRNTGTVPADLPDVLQRHLAGMGPGEALHALDALGRLADQAAADSRELTPAWLHLLAAETAACRTVGDVGRFHQLVADLLPIVADPEHAPAVAGVLAFARSTVGHAAAKEAERNRHRRK